MSLGSLRSVSRRTILVSLAALVSVSTLFTLYSDVAEATINMRGNSTAAVSNEIVYRGSSKNNNGNGTGSLAINMPTGTVENDIMVAALTIRGGTGTSITTVPTGWTQLDQKRDSTTVLTQVVYWKKAGAGESGSYTWNFTSAKASGVILSYANCDPTTPISSSLGQVNGVGTTYTAPSLTTTVAGERLLTFFGGATSGTMTASGATPVTIRDQDGATTGGQASTRTQTAGGDLHIAAAGNTGAKTVTATSAVSVGHSVTLRPQTGTSMTLTKPGGTAQNDVLIAGVTITGNTTVTAPVGWTSVRSDTTASNEIRTESWYKVAGSSEPADYTFSWTGGQRAVGGMVAYSGVDTANPTNVSNGQANTDSITISAPAVTPTTAYTQLVGIFGLANSSSITASSPLTSRATANITGGSSSAAIAIADQVYPSTGDTGIRTATAGIAGVGTGQLVALTPSISTLSQGSHRWYDQNKLQAGVNWVNRVSVTDDLWNAVTYGNGLFVAVAWGGTGNRVMTSPDGITWTSRTSAADNQWESVTYGNGLFVAVADSGTGNRVMTSPDGITWTSRTSAADNNWYSVTYGNGLFVAVAWGGTGNDVMTSPDGINWTLRSNPAVSGWQSVTYGNGLFVAVSNSGTGNRVMTSPDGITWTSRTSAANNSWRSVTYGNGLFVAVSNSGTGNRVMTSPDGITWTSRTSAADSDWQSVSYGGGLFVAVARAGTGGRVMTSPDGVAWTSRTAAADNEWYSVTYGNDLFVAVASSGAGNRVMTSLAEPLPTAASWTARTSATNNTWMAVTYGNGLFVAVAWSGTGNRVMTSPDGITWTSRTSATDNDWESVAYGNGVFVAVASSGTGNRVMTSPDGITWTVRTSAADNSWQSITYGNGLFVAVASSGTGNRVMTSPDGITWTVRTSAANNSWQSITYGNGLFVAVACNFNDSLTCGSTAGNRVMTSPDGITWTSRATPADNQWIGVSYGNGLFVAVAQSGTGNRVMTSPDGITWTARTSAADNSWSSVTYGNGLFVAVAYTGTGNRVMTSPDGITWTARTSAADNSWYSVTYGGGLFVAVAGSGTGNLAMTAPVFDMDVGGVLAGQDTAITATASDSVRLRMNIGASGSTWQAGDPAQQKLALQYAKRTGSVCTASETYNDIGTNTWSAYPSANDNVNWKTVAYGNGLFVAVATNDIMTSTNGVDWSTQASPVGVSAIAVTYGNGLFVIVPGYGNQVATSSDGVTWVVRNAAMNKNWRSVTYGNGLFVAVSEDSGNNVMTSPDGINWTMSTGSVDYLQSVTYGNNLFVAVGRPLAGSSIMTSRDGINWTSRIHPINQGYSSVTYGNGLYVAVSFITGANPPVLTSPDGIAWTARTSPADNGWTSVTYGNGLFVAVSRAGTGNRVMTSPDGVNWTLRASAADNVWTSVTYGGGLFVAVASSGDGISNYVMTMSPEINWGGKLGSNGTTIPNVSDPTQGGSTIKKQQYVTNNYFTNYLDVAPGEYGMFDFDLDMSKASYGSSYCFRVVNQNSSVLNSYAAYPEITRCTVPPLDQRMRHNKAFCGGSQRFMWSRAGV